MSRLRRLCEEISPREPVHANRSFAIEHLRPAARMLRLADMMVFTAAMQIPIDTMGVMHTKLKRVQWRRLQSQSHTPLLQVRIVRTHNPSRPLWLRAPSAAQLTRQLLRSCLDTLRLCRLPSEAPEFAELTSLVSAYSTEPARDATPGHGTAAQPAPPPTVEASRGSRSPRFSYLRSQPPRRDAERDAIPLDPAGPSWSKGSVECRSGSPNSITSWGARDRTGGAARSNLVLDGCAGASIADSAVSPGPAPPEEATLADWAASVDAVSVVEGQTPSDAVGVSFIAGVGGDGDDDNRRLETDLGIEAERLESEVERAWRAVPMGESGEGRGDEDSGGDCNGGEGGARRRRGSDEDGERAPLREGIAGGGAARLLTLRQLLRLHCFEQPAAPVLRARNELEAAIAAALSRAEQAALKHEPFLEAAALREGERGAPPPTIRTIDVGCVRVDGCELWADDESEAQLMPQYAQMGLTEQLACFDSEQLGAGSARVSLRDLVRSEVKKEKKEETVLESVMSLLKTVNAAQARSS